MNGRKSGEKKDQAFRIMEALSGVDAALLERSEKTCDCAAELRPGDAGKAGKPDGGMRIYRFVHRHGRACAACLCLALLGAAFWGLTFGPYGSGQDKAADYSETAATGMKTESMAEAAPQTPEEGAANGIGTEEAAEEGIKPEATKPETETKKTELAEDGVSGDTQCVTEALIEDQSGLKSEQTVNSGISASKQEQLEEEISWEEAYDMEALGEHIPVTLPEGYEPSVALCGTTVEGENKLILTWSNGEKTFRLCLSGGGMIAGLRSEADEAINAAEENWKDKLPEPGEDGFIAFGLLLEDGVQAEYQGYLSKEEICALFDSIQ